MLSFLIAVKISAGRRSCTLARMFCTLKIGFYVKINVNQIKDVLGFVASVCIVKIFHTGIIFYITVILKIRIDKLVRKHAIQSLHFYSYLNFVIISIIFSGLEYR